jgi:hypothetical protein
MAHVAMSPEISAWVTDRISMFPREAPEQLRWLAPSVVEYAALPLYVGWWDTTGIRPDGAIVSWSTEDELSGYSGMRLVEDRYQWLSALVDGCRRYERLIALLPTRPAGAVECPYLAHALHAEGKVFCPKCCGLGWVEPSGAQPGAATDPAGRESHER